MQPEGFSANGAHLTDEREPSPPAPAAPPPDDVFAQLVQTEPSVPAPRPVAQPVQPLERVAAVDVLRGVALMGILAMNIVAFAWPGPVYDSPRAGDNTSTTDLVVWAFNHVVFDEKMMTIFSMLFGAGLVLMTERSDARGASLAGVYYRRVTWLLIIGLLHAYLLWFGDILVLYAECGFLLYLLRRRSPRTLILVGTLCVLLPVLLGAGVTTILRMSQENYWGIGGTPRDVLSRVGDFLNQKITPEPEKVAEKFAESIRVHRGGWEGIASHRARNLFMSQTIGFVIVALWMVGGRMLIGMGLMKLDVFSARRSRRFYLWMVALGYGFGLPVVLFDTRLRIAVDFQGIEMVPAQMIYGYLSAFGIAAGHVGLVMLVYQSGAVPWLTRRLAAAGRMALSNYLMQSLICTTLFYGYGFALFGKIDRLGLAGIVVAIWTLQLATSIVWLRYFRYGPAEWVWRTLTYWKLQPLLARSPVPAPAAVASEGIVIELPASTAHFDKEG